MSDKEIYTAFAFLLTAIAYTPYLYDTIKKNIQPHPITWGIWGITTLIIFCAQQSDGGGVGTWAIGFSGVYVVCIALLSFFYSTSLSIKPSDWFFLSGALISLMLWYFSETAMWTVITLSIMNMIGFGPLFSKVSAAPYSERIRFFAWLIPRNILACLGLEHYSIITLFFPLAATLTCLVLVIFMAIKRYKLSTYQ